MFWPRRCAGDYRLPRERHLIQRPDNGVDVGANELGRGFRGHALRPAGLVTTDRKRFIYWMRRRDVARCALTARASFLTAGVTGDP